MALTLMKGSEAIAEAAIRAGCRYFFGYPITPQTEIPEYMSERMPEIGGCFLQEAAADLGHTLRHVLRDLSLRGDGVAEEVAAAGTDGGLGYGFAALHKSQCHISFLLIPSRCG